jgi:hypothetical protein
VGSIAWIILGLLAGLIAKAILPGEQPGKSNPVDGAKDGRFEVPAHFAGPHPVPTTTVSIGRIEMGERKPNPERETPDSKPESGDAGAGSVAEQAKEREREMEENGEENAA